MRLGFVIGTVALVLALQADGSATPTTCPVSFAKSPSPPGLMAGSYFYSNGKLWVAFPEERRGVIHARRYGDGTAREDGSIDIKSPWYRGVAGRLKISGHRLDKPALPLRAWVPSGYGRIGFQATAIIFPTPGCWRVTGRAGTAILSFVVRVYR